MRARIPLAAAAVFAIAASGLTTPAATAALQPPDKAECSGTVLENNANNSSFAEGSCKFRISGEDVKFRAFVQEDAFFDVGTRLTTPVATCRTHDLSFRCSGDSFADGNSIGELDWEVDIP
ncbi:hypothetical protein GCM10009799_51230 [Nocardiopsis rhodophaea]|uniref:Uncharacterized protein n=1 Tax=Nocardiopsis rhodophaea TaxID=280238 RepID=A0ABN2TQ84_9ACTN